MNKKEKKQLEEIEAAKDEYAEKVISQEMTITWLTEQNAKLQQNMKHTFFAALLCLVAFLCVLAFVFIEESGEETQVRPVSGVVYDFYNNITTMTFDISENGQRELVNIIQLNCARNNFKNCEGSLSLNIPRS